MTENYQRKYGRGKVARDLRNFDREHVLSQKDLNEARIRREYVLLALKTPITDITPDIVEHVSHYTGVDERTVERFLIQNYPHGNIDDFFLSYKELAHMGTAGARDFETATCEIFRKIFHMRAEHVGPIGNTPDVFIESQDAGYCGIIDNKSYKIDTVSAETTNVSWKMFISQNISRMDRLNRHWHSSHISLIPLVII